MFKVEFYSTFSQKWVTISKHRKLITAVKKARFYYVEGGYWDLSILSTNGCRLERYGSVCYFCNDSICEGSMKNECQK